MRSRDEFFDFLSQLARTEGAWVIEPTARASSSDFDLLRYLEHLRTVPARISAADPKRPYRFAERGEHGRWLFVWVPDK